jgi:hypothetical protein
MGSFGGLVRLHVVGWTALIEIERWMRETARCDGMRLKKAKSFRRQRLLNLFMPHDGMRT